MASDLKQQIERVQAKARLFGEKYHALRQSYDGALNEISDLKAQNLAQRQTIEQLQLKIEYLTVATTLTPSREDLQATRSMIANLIKEIDSCIADLIE